MVSGKNNNIIEDAVQSIINLTILSTKILGNIICKLLNIEQCAYDFEKFFINSNIINNEKEYPNFKKWYKDEEYSVYIFSIPPGKSIIDFKQIIPAISNYIGVDEENVAFELNENKKDAQFIVYNKKIKYKI